LFLDIRGFSTYASTGESFDIAFYLRSVYTHILDSYFPKATFFKPTGDGLLVIHELPATPHDLRTAISSLLTNSIGLTESFGELTASDVMVTGAPPSKLGIGLARGTATRLVSDGTVLDYTGRCLNLAARLMDKARPYGVVFQDDKAADLIDESLASTLSSDHVCIRGISEREPLTIYVSEGVLIRPADREPMIDSEYQYGEALHLTVEEVRKQGNFGFYLPRAPRSYEVAGVFVEYPSFAAGKATGHRRTLSIEEGRLEEHPNGLVLYISLSPVIQHITNIPISTKFLLWDTKTKVTFTPYLRPKNAKRLPS